MVTWGCYFGISSHRNCIVCYKCFLVLSVSLLVIVLCSFLIFDQNWHNYFGFLLFSYCFIDHIVLWWKLYCSCLFPLSFYQLRIICNWWLALNHHRSIMQYMHYWSLLYRSSIIRIIFVLDQLLCHHSVIGHIVPFLYSFYCLHSRVVVL